MENKTKQKTNWILMLCCILAGIILGMVIMFFLFTFGFERILNTNSEQIFLFVKNQDYFFDLDSIRVKHKEVSLKRRETGWSGKTTKGCSWSGLNKSMKLSKEQIEELAKRGKNCGDCIMFPLEPSSENHYAMFPKTIPEFCIKAGCPKEGIVLDPFSGGGTTLYVAKHLLRNYIGIEINPTYIKEIQNNKLAQEVLI